MAHVLELERRMKNNFHYLIISAPFPVQVLVYKSCRLKSGHAL